MSPKKYKSLTIAEKKKLIEKVEEESLDKQLNANITVLTAILLIDKAWRAVTPLTILNCFKKSGFLKEDQENLPILMDDEEPAIEPLVHISGVSFSDFVQVDEDVAVSGSLIDGEILSATDTNENSNDEDEDDTSEPLAEVSVKKARSSYDTLRTFCLQNESDEKAFQALFLLKKIIEQSEQNESDEKAFQALFLLKKIIEQSEQQQCALKQTSLPEFFRKIN
ncbi:hypothetical protein QE152_g268 [Popillia japonica]|uniref:Uncharacterized protein n=1 Tax=Popillia japonica TaxID=7064 RepID=A0AAW1NJY3_POPJA